MVFCKNCLKEIKTNLRRDDILVLIALNEKNAFNNQCSLSRETIQQLAELTLARTVNSLMRLESCCFVERSLWGKVHRYHITENGIEILKILNEEVL
ncbi:hypothetical protein [Thermosipho sp. (in: thermotogales)]|uniref:hypothetical protein n=1 Tax=Thermosipho sp. (in: thermotogales) TaxID=1968895 RepID=UPI00257CA6C1|nr:hypothetical protein [Thermosipho sp. (in: thermotogales)]